MSSLYFQCDRGAAGDIITAALFELMPDPFSIRNELNQMGIPGVAYIPEPRKKYGISGCAMEVLINGAEEEEVMKKSAGENQIHRTLTDVQTIIDRMNVTETIKKMIRDVYGIIADAESRAHQCKVEEVHFHEVGALDAIADVAAVCYLMDKLQPERVLASKVGLGNGTVWCAHGLLPVPAPATANILEGVPCTRGEMNKEACTPTGAALLRYFTDRFDCPAPQHSLDCGIGIGRRTFNVPSYFKAILF